MNKLRILLCTLLGMGALMLVAPSAASAALPAGHKLNGVEMSSRWHGLQTGNRIHGIRTERPDSIGIKWRGVRPEPVKWRGVETGIKMRWIHMHGVRTERPNWVKWHGVRPEPVKWRGVTVKPNSNRWH